MVTTPPRVSLGAHYSVSESAKLLQVSRSTLYKAINIGAQCGGIDTRVRRDNGRRYITAEEILRYWWG